jgi:hypothetical protein
VNGTAPIKFPGLSYTCAEANEAGLRKIIPNQVCTGLVAVVVENCGCQANVTSVAPSASPQDTVTAAPASAASVTQGIFSSFICVLSLLLL